MCLWSRMNVLLCLSLCFVLLMPTCCGNDEDELPSDYDSDTTATPDYDYNATFDYYYVTAVAGNKAAGIGQLTPVLLLGLAVHQIWN